MIIEAIPLGLSKALVAGCLTAGFSSPGVAYSAPVEQPTGVTVDMIPQPAPLQLYARLRHCYGSAAAITCPTSLAPTGGQSFQQTIVEINSPRILRVSGGDVPQSVPQVIAYIRSTLSLCVKELAEIVAVERPTIYAWIKQESLPQRPNLERLHAIYRIAKQWSKSSITPLGRSLKEVDAKGTSLLDLLCEAPLPAGRIEGLLASIAKARLSPPEMPSEADKISIRKLASQNGIDLRRVRTQETVVEVVTGKPIHTD